MGRLILPILETPRLRLRPAGPGDLPLFVGLNADPEVMRFVLGRAASAAETEAEWAERLGARSDVGRGLGYWTGLVDGASAGWWSASVSLRGPHAANLGYRLVRAHWGAGLATEGARAVAGHALGLPGLTVCEASTMAVNTGSRRVLEKLGMTHVETYVDDRPDPPPDAAQGEVVYERRRVAGENTGAPFDKRA